MGRTYIREPHQLACLVAFTVRVMPALYATTRLTGRGQYRKLFFYSP